MSPARIAVNVMSAPERLYAYLDEQGTSWRNAAWVLLWASTIITALSSAVVWAALALPWIFPQEHTGWAAAGFTILALACLMVGTLGVASTSMSLTGISILLLSVPSRPKAHIAVAYAVFFVLAQVFLAAGVLAGVIGDGAALVAIIVVLLSAAAFSRAILPSLERAALEQGE